MRPARFTFVWLCLTSLCEAHPLGPFTISHYSRLHISREAIQLRYVLDLAEVATIEELPSIDTDRDQAVSDAEKETYLERKMSELAGRLSIQLNGQELAWEVVSGDLIRTFDDAQPVPAKAWSTLRIICDFETRLPRDLAGENTVMYQDRNLPQRPGWKEVIVNADEDITLLRSSAPRSDASAELSRFPSDPTIIPPQIVSAEFEFARGPRLVSHSTIIWTAAALAATAILLVLRKRFGVFLHGNS
jgi:hypothetical protein